MFLWKLVRNSGSGTLIYFLAILFLYCQVLILDWGALITSGQDSLYSFLPKYIISLSSFLFVWFSGKNRIENSDQKILKAAFMMILIADTLMVITPHFHLYSSIPFFLIGLGFFILTHIFLFIRVARRWPKIIQKDRTNHNFNRLTALLFSGVLLILISVGIVMLIRNELVSLGLFIPLSLYMLFLTASVWMGITTLLLPEYFPVLNARVSALAMLCFYACDVSIGFSMISSVPEIKTLFLDFTWLFYTPCLFLLAISGTKLRMK